MTHAIMPPRLLVQAMRDRGYKNAAYAIAELVDNSLQSGASISEVICEEKEFDVGSQRRARTHRLAVIDNGCGMDEDTLRIALQFGNGTRLEDREGIGRFGMGLPNSSLSQATRVEVYTWQNGIDNAIFSYLDIDEISRGDMDEVPEPVHKSVPTQWINHSETVSESRSGTIVLWSNLDKLRWKQAKTLFNHSEFLIGRMYRRPINNGSLRIRFAAFDSDEGSCHTDRDAAANDPLYLMKDTSCPDWPGSPDAMYQLYAEPTIYKGTGKDGRQHQVTLTMTLAKQEARSSDNSGALPWGKHAEKNWGVSVMRADRELEMQTEWCIKYDPVERWWSAEIDFPPALDEVFGVPNNKQGAPGLGIFATLTAKQFADQEGYSSEQELRQAWSDEGDPRLLLLEIQQDLISNIKVIRKTLKAQTRGQRTRGEGRHPQSAEIKGTKGTQKRKEDGKVGGSDSDEQQLDPAVRVEEIASTLIDEGMPEDLAKEEAQGLVESRTKYQFFTADVESATFFSVKRKAGAILIGLNQNHPAFSKLVSLLEDDQEDESAEELQARLKNAYEGLKLLLISWARYEDELSDGERRELIQDARMDWGRVARDFFTVE